MKPVYVSFTRSYKSLEISPLCFLVIRLQDNINFIETRQHKIEMVKKTLRERMDECDSDAINTIEYGFYYVNGVLATTQRISHENGEGDTEQVPADFYWIVDEARERLDKIRTLLGFISETDDSKENSEVAKGL